MTYPTYEVNYPVDLKLEFEYEVLTYRDGSAELNRFRLLPKASLVFYEDAKTKTISFTLPKELHERLVEYLSEDIGDEVIFQELEAVNEKADIYR